MRWGGVVFMVVLVSGRVYGSDFTVVPPTDWVPDEANAASSREGLERTRGVSAIDAKAWRAASPTAGHLVISSFTIAVASQPELEVIDRQLASGFTRNSTVLKDQPLRSWAWGDGYLGDLMVVIAGHQVHVVRRYFGARDGVHALIALCEHVVDQSSCEPAMDSVQFPVKDPVPLPAEAREPREGDITNVAKVLVIVGVAAWLARGRWARATAATALRRSAHATPDAIGSAHDPVDPSRVESPDVGGPGPAETKPEA